MTKFDFQNMSERVLIAKIHRAQNTVRLKQINRLSRQKCGCGFMGKCNRCESLFLLGVNRTRPEYWNINDPSGIDWRKVAVNGQ